MIPSVAKYCVESVKKLIFNLHDGALRLFNRAIFSSSRSQSFTRPTWRPSAGLSLRIPWAIGRHAAYGILTTLSVCGLALEGCESKENPDEISGQFAFGVEKQSGDRPQFSNQTVKPRPTAIQRPQEHWPRIVAFGDSLTAGYGLLSDESYPAQLQERLIKANYRYQVINAGVSGDTTAGGLRRLDWVLKSRPTIVILVLGGNDGLRGLPLDDTYANLEKIIQRLKAEGVTILLAGMKIPPNYGEAYTSEFSMMYEKLAGEYDLKLMPFFLEDVAMRPHLIQADGIHPTAEGYQIIVDNLLESLVPLLEAGAEVKS
ncbi:MAG: arylesterase [Nitrospirota bacterium]|nr:MAG: arylesterase [Nitrospirota bacterium]